MRAEGGSVVHIEFPRQASFRKGGAQSGGVMFHTFMAKELGMTNQTAHVIDKGKQIRFSSFPLDGHLRAVHAVGLPDVVGKLRLKSPAVYRNFFSLHQTSLLEQAVDGRRMRLDARMEDLPEPCF